VVAVERHLKPARLDFGAVVAETGQPVDGVYFPHTGVISLVVDCAARTNSPRSAEF
jgi:hypothetical protein